MTIGERIRMARKQAGMTQKELANMVGFPTASVISQWETGVRKPTITTLQKIAQALEIPFETLILDDENERSNTMGESKTIDFGSGPVGFSQEIDEAAKINRSECNCDEKKDPVKVRGEEKMREKIKNLQEKNDALRIEQSRQLDLYNRANEKCMTALEAMEAGMEKLQTAIVENDLSFEQLGDLTEKLARLGSAISAVRMSMGLQVPPYLLGINSGFNSFGGD